MTGLEAVGAVELALWVVVVLAAYLAVGFVVSWITEGLGFGMFSDDDFELGLFVALWPGALFVGAVGGAVGGAWWIARWLGRGARRLLERLGRATREG